MRRLGVPPTALGARLPVSDSGRHRPSRCAPAPRAEPGPPGRALLTATSDGRPSIMAPFEREKKRRPPLPWALAALSSSQEKSFSSSFSTPLPWEKAFSSSLHRRHRLWARGIIRDSEIRLFGEGVRVSLAVAAAVGPRVPFPRVPSRRSRRYKSLRPPQPLHNELIRYTKVSAISFATALQGTQGPKRGSRQCGICIHNCNCVINAYDLPRRRKARAYGLHKPSTSACGSCCRRGPDDVIRAYQNKVDIPT